MSSGIEFCVVDNSNLIKNAAVKQICAAVESGAEKRELLQLSERMNPMKINEYDHVCVIASGDAGIVVDIRTTNNTYFTVERDGDNKLLDCTESDIEKIEL